MSAQLASYKLASHATAQRAVLAARQALQGVPEEATTSVDMDGTAEIIACPVPCACHPLTVCSPSSL